MNIYNKTTVIYKKTYRYLNNKVVENQKLGIGFDRNIYMKARTEMIPKLNKI